MSNSNSLYNKYSRYVCGGTTEQANGFAEWWERTIFDVDPSDASFIVESFFENRLDLISSTFYDDPRYAWFIAQYNNILDPFSEIVAGRVLRIPSKDRLSLMLNSKKGGVESTRQPTTIISPIIS